MLVVWPAGLPMALIGTPTDGSPLPVLPGTVRSVQVRPLSVETAIPAVPLPVAHEEFAMRSAWTAASEIRDEGPADRRRQGQDQLA